MHTNIPVTAKGERLGFFECRKCDKYSSRLISRVIDHLVKVHGVTKMGAYSSVAFVVYHRRSKPSSVSPSMSTSSALTSLASPASTPTSVATTAASVTTSTSSASSHVDVPRLASYVDATEQVSSQFSCRYCAKLFANDAHLTLHLKANHGKREMYQCRQCSYFSAWRGEIVGHLRGHHRTNKSDRSYKTTSKNYKKIINKALADSIYNGANGENEEVASANLKWDGADDEYKKEHSSLKNKCISSSTSSQATSSKSANTCNFCQNNFISSAQVKVHVNAMHTRKIRFRCGICSYSSFRQSYCLTHLRKIHDIYEKNTPHLLVEEVDVLSQETDKKIIVERMEEGNCVQRNKYPSQGDSQLIMNNKRAFASLTKTRSGRQIADHGERKIYQCQQCSYFSNWKSALVRHLKQKHADNRTEQSIKPGEKISYIRKTPGHEEDARSINEAVADSRYDGTAGPSKFKCRYCAERFANITDLKPHLKANHSEAEMYHQCPVCTYFSAYPGTIVRHLRQKHADNRTKRSIKPGERISHSSCRYCAERFANNAQLTLHLKANHAEREMYQCQQCSYFSAWRSKIVKHLRGHHRTKKSRRSDKRSINEAVADSRYDGAAGVMKQENEQVASADLKWDGADDEYKKENEEIVSASFKIEVDDEAFYFGAENEATAESESNSASPSFSDSKLFPGDPRLRAHENAVHIKEERE